MVLWKITNDNIALLDCNIHITDIIKKRFLYQELRVSSPRNRSLFVFYSVRKFGKQAISLVIYIYVYFCRKTSCVLYILLFGMWLHISDFSLAIFQKYVLLKKCIFLSFLFYPNGMYICTHIYYIVAEYGYILYTTNIHTYM